jgi:membrane fusion protein (multidrug efflux system)
LLNELLSHSIIGITKNKIKMRKISSPFFFLLFSIILISCKEDKNLESKEVYPVTQPIYIDSNTYVDYVAEIMAVQNIEIRAKAQGYLEKVLVDEGQFVKKDQLLFQINNREYLGELAQKSAALKIAQAEAKSAELELENTKKLVEKNVVSKTELEFAKNNVLAAKGKVEQAQAEETQAKQMLSYTDIRAPFDGVINRLPQKIGSLVTDGTLLTTLSQNESVFAYFDVSEKEYLDFMSRLTKESKKEREVQLVLANGKLHKQIGTIETMDGEFDSRTGNLSFRARFENPDKLLKHGSSGKIRIEKDLKHALIIPQKATFEIQDRIFVFVVDKTGKVSMRQVEIKTRIPHLYVVASGLKSNEKIIYEGIQSLSEGMEIEEEFIPLRKIMFELSKN